MNNWLKGWQAERLKEEKAERQKRLQAFEPSSPKQLQNLETPKA